MTDTSTPPPEHTVSAFGEDLQKLTDLIVRMGGLAEAQLATALQAMSRRDSELAGRVITSDRRIDEMEQEIHAFVVRLIALRQRSPTICAIVSVL